MQMTVDWGSQKERNKMSVFVGGFRHSQGESSNLSVIIKIDSKITYYLRARK